MNDPSRQIGIELFLGVAACVAAATILVDPLHKKIVAANDEATRLVAFTGPGAAGPIIPADRAAEVLANSQRQLAQIAKQGEAVRDKAALYTSLMSAAERHSIKVDQVQPANSSKPTGSANKNAPLPPPMAPGVWASAPAPATIDVRGESTIFLMTAEGAYGNLTAFLRELQDGGGLLRIRSVRLDPVQNSNPPLLRAMIETEHFTFEIAQPTVAAGAEGNP
ncbi:MAG: hypothetical protein KF745_00565 [Phycisphaeraceae bacterium]|nr:hypothetical protein [Phycisphaeraceae bacterium]